MQPGEFVSQVHVPLPRKGSGFREWKISKRFDQDIAAVCGAFLLALDGGRIAAARRAWMPLKA